MEARAVLTCICDSVDTQIIFLDSVDTKTIIGVQLDVKRVDGNTAFIGCLVITWLLFA